MPPRSAGLLPYRLVDGALAVLLVHPGGPFWRNKHSAAWQIAKGMIAPGEPALEAALREAAEELGTRFEGNPAPLGEIRQAGGKYVEAFALEAEFDPDTLASNQFELEWPPRGGKLQSFPEVDAARWFAVDDAREMMLASQRPFLDRLEALLAA